jgi:hypothetical protein
MGITGFTGIRVGSMQTQALTHTTAVTITPPVDSDFILIECHQHDMRITFDGSAPTTSYGFKLNKDTPYRVDVGFDTTIRVIAMQGNPNCYWQAFRVKRDDNA